MNYKMKVTIANPKTPAGMSSDIVFILDAIFVYDPDQYGNKHYLLITNNDSFENYYDIRYDRDFNPDNKIAYLEAWAHSYWSGKNGAYYVKDLKITKAE